MSEPINFNSQKFGSYTLTLDDQTVLLNCYLRGSVTGGSGTECGHKISGENVSKFLNALEVNDFSELDAKARKLKSKGWQNLHLQIMEFQTESWTWSETNWND